MIRLRELQDDDKEMIRKWRNLPEVARYMYSDHQITAAEHDQWFHRVRTDPAYKYWIIECDDQDVGLANLYDIDRSNKRCFWAFYLSSPHARGKGVGGYVEYRVLCHVFCEMKLKKLSCEVLAFNEAVIRMHESFGFKREGTFRRHIQKGGQFHDVVRLAILSDEWDQLKPRMEARLRQRGVLPKDPREKIAAAQ